MKGYIVSVICACIISFIVSTLAPEGEGGGIGKTLRLALGLMIIAVFLSPVSTLVSEVKNMEIDSIIEDKNDVESYEKYFYEAYDSAEKKNLINGIGAMLWDEFEIDESEAEVSVEFYSESDEKKLRRIFVLLHGDAMWKDTGAIEKYLKDIFDCEIITAIG